MLKVGFNKHFQKCLGTLAFLLLLVHGAHAQKLPATVILSNLSNSYDGTPHAATAITIPPGLRVDITYDGFPTPPTNAGSYTTVGTINDLLFEGSDTETLTISKVTLTATANDAGRHYGAPNPSLTARYSGFVNGEDASVIDIPPTVATAATTATPVGSYGITISGGTDKNYNFSYVPGTLTIDPAPLTADANDQSRSYGQVNPALTITYTGFVNGDNASDITPPTASTTATASSAAGTYPITLSGGSAANYNLTLQGGALTVTKAALIAGANDQSRSYGQVNPALTITYTGFVNGDNASDITSPTATTIATASSAAGTYPITLSGGSATNYTLTLQGGTLTVTKVALTADANDQSRSYGQVNPALTITYTGFVNGDNASAITAPTASTTATASSAAGTYPITLSGGSAANYNLTLQGGTLTVTKAALTADANDQSKSYGLVNPALTITYTGFVNGDNASTIIAPTASTTATASSAAGTYPITLTGGSAANYNLTLQNGTLTVTKAALVADADDQSRVYGQANPTLTISYTGFVNGDNASAITAPTASTPATASSAAGTYPISLSGGSAANYNLTLQSGTLTITKVTLTAKADNQSKVYGQANPTFTISYTGFINGDNASAITAPTVSTTATTSSGAGSYPITLSGGSAANYNLTLQNGALTVTKAALTADANDQSRSYGLVNPALTITYTGFVNGDNASTIIAPTAITTATASSATGTYPITLSGGSAANYNLTLQGGTLTVTKAALTADANDQSRSYGQVNPALTITYTGFVNGDNASTIIAPTASTTATASSAAGTYPITLSGGSAVNYNLTLQSGTLTITKGALTAKADDQSKAYGQGNPAFTISYTGFVNGDNASAITTPTASTTATASSAAGTYPITLSGGSAANYNLMLQGGTLTVTKVALIADANDQSRSY